MFFKEKMRFVGVPNIAQKHPGSHRPETSRLSSPREFKKVCSRAPFASLAILLCSVFTFYRNTQIGAKLILSGLPDYVVPPNESSLYSQKPKRQMFILLRRHIYYIQKTVVTFEFSKPLQKERKQHHYYTWCVKKYKDSYNTKFQREFVNIHSVQNRLIK